MSNIQGPGATEPVTPEDPDVSVPQRAPAHEPPLPVKDPVEPDTPQPVPLKT